MPAAQAVLHQSCFCHEVQAVNGRKEWSRSEDTKKGKTRRPGHRRPQNHQATPMQDF
jgi:hypothetical protein